MVSQRDYDVIIVGAGPAGIFAALELSKSQKLRTIILDKGKDISERANTPNSLLSGWGGAGAYSDGKLTLSSEIGGWLRDYVPEEELSRLLGEVDNIYLEHGVTGPLYGNDEDAIAEIARRAAQVDLRLVPSKIRHMGTEVCPIVLQKMKQTIQDHVDIGMGVNVTKLLVHDQKITGVETVEGETIHSKYVVVAPGRGGADWIHQEALRLGLNLTNNPVDIGVRVEVPAAVLDHLTRVLYEPKFVYYTKAYDDKVRTFCVCPNGFVIPEYVNDLVTVNGQSYASKKSENTNFAILVSTRFTEPFKEPITYGKYIAKLANLLGGGVLVQRLGDLESGRRSTAERLARSIVEPTLKEAMPGDLSFVLPGRHLSDIKEMLVALDKIAPGIDSRHTLIYGVEVKFYSSRPELSDTLETRIHNLFAIGDGAGITRGLTQASASGLIVAREILRRSTASAHQIS
ncbi:MAG TPA: FAD-dependent oxidoreductase [Candidatus Bathyarchaeia archaeon]|nr:FAD-dependent oxidoreductase [Candidatus Bathyarchaeia archaeon]